MYYLRLSLMVPLVVALTIVYTFSFLCVNCISTKKAHTVARWWIKGFIGMLHFIFAVRIKIEGLENIPKKSFVIVANHQSFWETFYIPYILWPVAPVAKDSLLKIPLFGFMLKRVPLIAIDRSKPKQALAKMLNTGKEILNSNINILIFPEGTRSKEQSIGNYKHGAIKLAQHAKAPVLPITHNSGTLFGKNRTPGARTIHIIIGKPITIDAAQDSRATISTIEQWARQEFMRINA